MRISEEEKVVAMSQTTYENSLSAYTRIPYSLISNEIEGSSKDFLEELNSICKYYEIYKKGASFNVEGTNGDYVAATLKYKLAANLINKEARFLFAESPDISAEHKGDLGSVTEEAKSALTNMNDLIKTVLDKNNFEEQLIKAAKDCFIGKRVACLVNFNEEDGVTVNFIPSTQFLFETKLGNTNIISKFVCFIVEKENSALKDKRVFKKKFELVDNVVYLEEIMYDGAGRELEVITEYQETLMHMIPAVIFLNDGLTGDMDGESEICGMEQFESWYSKLSNADKDAQRKSMNPTKYAVDMDARSTKGLSSSAGAFWDLGSDQNLDNSHPMIGMLEPSMSYSDSLKTTLDRIKTNAFEMVDMPNVNLETMVGSITSGKALKSIYWPLITRCKEKMKMWSPRLREVITIILEGAKVYPKCVEMYIDLPISPIAYEIRVEANSPLPEEEMEEKAMDISEVESMLMSKKSYMQKWRGLTNEEVQEELEQIALERQILEDSSFGGETASSTNIGINTNIGEEEPVDDQLGSPSDGDDMNYIDDIDGEGNILESEVE